MNWFDKFLDRAIERRIRRSAEPLGGWKPKQVACWDCGLSHTLPQNVRQALASAEGFFSRHEGHKVDWLERQGLAGLWIPNADVKEAFASSAAYTIALTSLATSSTLVAGRESTVISNATNLYLDYLIGGRITEGTTPTVDTTIEVWAHGNVDDTPTYVDTITGSDANASITSANVKRSALRLVERIFVDATTNRVYWFGPVSLAQVYGGNMPKNHGLFVVHATAVNLNSTPGNHVLNYTGVYNTVI